MLTGPQVIATVHSAIEDDGSLPPQQVAMVRILWGFLAEACRRDTDLRLHAETAVDMAEHFVELAAGPRLVR